MGRSTRWPCRTMPTCKSQILSSACPASASSVYWRATLLDARLARPGQARKARNYGGRRSASDRRAERSGRRRQGRSVADDGRYRVRMQVGAVGRLSTSEQFGDIVVRTDPVKGSIVLLKDVARIELGALRYTSSAFFGDRPTIGLAIYQAAGSNAVELKENVKAKMDELAKRFPPGIAYAMHYDTTRFVSAATRDVFITLGQALVLVVIVVFVFLQSWRTTIIPVIAIPVSLIATLVVMKLMGFSLNMLSLLGMVLAIRLVVDDAIVVVENAKLARSGEGCPVLVDKCFERRRRPTTNRFDQVVRAGED